MRRRAASTYDVDLGAGWQGRKGICSGMLVATLGRALGREFDGRDPFAISAQFPAPAGPGPATVHVAVLRRSRGLCTGRRRWSSTTSSGCGRSPRSATSTRSTGSIKRASADCPDLLPPEPARARPRPTGDSTSGSTRARATAGAGLAPAHRRPAAGPAHAPAGGRLAAQPRRGAVADLTAYVHARPAPGWLRLSRVTTGRGSDAEVWDSQDRLVAQSRRLASTVEASLRDARRPAGATLLPPDAGLHVASDVDYLLTALISCWPSSPNRLASKWSADSSSCRWSRFSNASLCWTSVSSVPNAACESASWPSKFV